MTTQLETPAPVKTRKPKSKPARSLAIIEQHGDEMFIAITVGKQTSHYWIEPLAGVDFGAGFAFTKDDGTVYNVNVNGKESLCDCRGFGRHAHCKHVDSTRKLQELTLLPVVMPLPEKPGEVLGWDNTEWD